MSRHSAYTEVAQGYQPNVYGGAPGYGAPAYGAPAYGAPAYGAPVYGQPMYGQPQPGPIVITQWVESKWLKWSSIFLIKIISFFSNRNQIE